MPNKPSMTTAEAEQVLGSRGGLNVTNHNRLIVRKWLNAQGFPALFTAGLSMRELGIAYNQTSGDGITQLRKKLSESASEMPEDTAEEATTETLPTATYGSHVPETTKGARPTNGATLEPAGDVGNAAQSFAAALLAQAGKAVDADQVRAIVTEALDKALPDIAAKATKRVTIEVKLPGSDTVETMDGPLHAAMPDLMAAAASRMPDGYHPNILIVGPAGSGKTTGCKLVAKALKQDFEFNGALTVSHEVLGYQDAAGTYHPTSFFRGYTGPCVYTFDDVDSCASNAPVNALNAALANGTASFPHGMFKRHIDSLIMATANTWGHGATSDYVGRIKLDGAFRDRFGVRIFWDYDEELERVMCGNAQWAARVQGARAKARAAGLKVLITPRASMSGAALIAGGMTEDRAASLTYLADLTTEQKQIVGQ